MWQYVLNVWNESLSQPTVAVDVNFIVVVAPARLLKSCYTVLVSWAALLSAALLCCYWSPPHTPPRTKRQAQRFSSTRQERTAVSFGCVLPQPTQSTPPSIPYPSTLHRWLSSSEYCLQPPQARRDFRYIRSELSWCHIMMFRVLFIDWTGHRNVINIETSGSNRRESLPRQGHPPTGNIRHAPMTYFHR